MFKRPKPGESEEDLLLEAEKFKKNGGITQSVKPTHKRKNETSTSYAGILLIYIHKKTQ